MFVLLSIDTVRILTVTHTWYHDGSIPAPLLHLLIICIVCRPEALCLVVETATLGVSVLSLCEKGDAFILAETGKVFKRENEMKKGEPKYDAGSLLSIRCTEDPSRGVYMPSVILIVEQVSLPTFFFLLHLWIISKWRSGGCPFPLSGISFPTSVSVNNCVCHFSPLKSDHDYTLKGGDLVKM